MMRKEKLIFTTLLAILLIFINFSCEDIKKEIKLIQEEFEGPPLFDIGEIDPDFNDKEKYKYMPRTDCWSIPFHRFPEYQFSEDIVIGSYENEYYRIEIYDIDDAGKSFSPVTSNWIPLGGLYLSIQNISDKKIVFNINGLFEIIPCSSRSGRYGEKFYSMDMYSAASLASGNAGSIVMISGPIDQKKKKKMIENAIYNNESDKLYMETVRHELYPSQKIKGIVYYDYAMNSCSVSNETNGRITCDTVKKIKFNIYIKTETGDKIIPSSWFNINVPEEKIKYWFFIYMCQCLGSEKECGERGYNYTGRIE
jgi:hypothetical protein